MVKNNTTAYCEGQYLLVKIAVTMKMDPDLKAKAEEAAKAESRSFANFVDVAIREKLARLSKSNRRP